MTVRLRARQSRRGVALLVVVMCVMFLTVLVTDINYGSRVRFLSAAHERDEAKSYWLGITGANVYRLLLMANKQLASNSMVKSMLEQFGIDPNNALISIVPYINTGLMRMMLSADMDAQDQEVEDFRRTGQVSDEVREESRQDNSRFANRNFLDFDGDFSAEVRGEDCRVNVNTLGLTSDITQDPMGKAIYGLMSGEENEAWLRDRNLERWQLIGNLADWIDGNNTVASGRGSDEDSFYNRLDSPYLAKNAKFDSLEEMRLVEGWQDEVWDRWGKELTIYGSGKINVNCASDEMIKAVLRAYSSTPLTDSQADQALELLHTYMARNVTTVTKIDQWIALVKEQLGYDLSTASSYLGVKTEVYTVTSVGTVGDATTTVTMVLDQSGTGRKAERGKVVYWRVD
jgi:general secretion pathway protein K